MKYKIIITKIDEENFLGFCPVLPKIRAEAGTVDEVLVKLQQELLCVLHDENPEFNVVNIGQKSEHRGAAEPLYIERDEDGHAC
ncbi:MAG: hypothetical protein JW803_01890 [Endomicrobiales bacterium]|nr:hypothetical protein [Endomicrobiales bacterium]